MEKSKLEKLRTLNATREMIAHARTMESKDVGIGWSNRKVTAYEYGLFMRCQQLSGILKIAIFLAKDLIAGKKKPMYEVFINPEAGEFLTRDMGNNDMYWRAAKLDMLDWPEYVYHSFKKKAWINQSGNNHITRELKTKRGGYEGILEYQLSIRKDELKERHRRETGPWDAQMDRVPELPKDFKAWAVKQGNPENFIFYEYKASGAKMGYCSYCEKDVSIKDPKHGKEGICPSCGRKITYKSSGKIKRLSTRKHDVQIIQPISGGGYVIRVFETERYYQESDYRNPKNYIHEYGRAICENGLIEKYYYELYKNQYNRWVKTSYYGYYSNYTNVKGRVYTRNLYLLEKNVLKTSAMPIMIRKNPNLNCERFAGMESESPALEKVVKAGLNELARDMMEGNVRINRGSSGELSKILSIDHARLKRLREMDGGAVALEWLQREKQEDTMYSDDLIRFLSSEQLTRDSINFIMDRMSVLKIVNYLKKQQELTKETLRQVITTWKDYLNMAKKAKMDVKNELIYKPKNLRQSHAEVIKIIETKHIKELEKETKKKFPKVNTNCKILSKYEWGNEKYTIIAPKGIEDIITEGITLRHCIHTCDYYFERIQTKETYLMFLRRTGEEDTPYYTLEIEPSGNIRQKRTLGDNQNKDFEEAVPFIKEWQKVISKRLTEEDKALGKISNEMRKKELAVLYKEDKRIWNGPLQGQSLAAVLEADFMEVLEAVG